MAIGIARRVHPLIALAALAAALTVAPTLASATPGPRSIPSVQKRLGQLAFENSQLVEKYDRAQVTVQQRAKAASAASAVAVKARAAYVEAHVDFEHVIQAQYESGGIGAAEALLSSSSGSNYLERLATLNMMSTHTAQVVDAVHRARLTADQAVVRANELLDAAKAERDRLADRRRQVEAQLQKYRRLLGMLNAQQQQAWQQSINPSVSAAQVSSLQHMVSAPSAAARKAVEFALAQVGKPYVFGAAGPDSYDCSGLTMAAWAHGGVSLPHSAADQYNYGTHVSVDQLQPGDLVFFYQPIGHVTIYIGNGLMVSAPTEGENVSVVPLSSFMSDYTGATRLAG